MSKSDTGSGRKKAFVVVANVLVCLLLLAAGVGVAAYFMQNRVAAKKVRRPAQAPLVEVIVPERRDATMRLQAMGTVAPAREVVLKPEISGTVQALSPDLTPGGMVKKGDLLLKLDPRQYQLEVTKSENEVQSAKADLAMEQGQQVVAREELKMLTAKEKNLILETDLALRKPQLLQAKVALEKAQAELEQAKLDLSRTEIRAPFNALVTELNVNLGSQVSSGSTLATIVGTDEFWVEAALPLDVLSLVNLGREGGVPVTVESQAGGGHWEGRLMRLTGALSEDTMMAKGIAVVVDPLAARKQGGKPLILGEYVTLEFDSEPLNNVFALPRKSLREGDAVWVVAGDAQQRKLDVRTVVPVGRDSEAVFIHEGLEDGDKVVVSDLSGALDGMRVMLEGDPVQTAPQESAGPGPDGMGPGGMGPGGMGPGSGQHAANGPDKGRGKGPGAEQ